MPINCVTAATTFHRHDPSCHSRKEATQGLSTVDRITTRLQHGKRHTPLAVIPSAQRGLNPKLTPSTVTRASALAAAAGGARVVAQGNFTLAGLGTSLGPCTHTAAAEGTAAQAAVEPCHVRQGFQALAAEVLAAV